MAHALELFGDRLAVQASMQKTAGVLMHIGWTLNPNIDIIFVDTGVHFRETLSVRDEFINRFGMNILSFEPERTFEEQYADFGRHLYLNDDTSPGAAPGYRYCCMLRKEQPFVNAVKGKYDGIVGGLTRAEGGRRAATQVLHWDSRIDAYKIYPLAYASESFVDDYTKEYDLPVHPLYAKGYQSIGCFTCTTPVKPGEDKRAGRWRHIREGNPELQAQPLYCGINLEDAGNNI